MENILFYLPKLFFFFDRKIICSFYFRGIFSECCLIVEKYVWILFDKLFNFPFSLERLIGSWFIRVDLLAVIQFISPFPSKLKYSSTTTIVNLVLTRQWKILRVGRDNKKLHLSNESSVETSSTRNGKCWVCRKCTYTNSDKNQTLTLSRIYDAPVTVTYFLFFIFFYFFKAEKSMLLFFSFFIVVKTRIYHWQDN